MGERGPGTDWAAAAAGASELVMDTAWSPAGARVHGMCGERLQAKARWCTPAGGRGGVGVMLVIDA
jgi:hypothetical protein